jgi:hypothetical protein
MDAPEAGSEEIRPALSPSVYQYLATALINRIRYY